MQIRLLGDKSVTIVLSEGAYSLYASFEKRNFSDFFLNIVLKY